MCTFLHDSCIAKKSSPPTEFPVISFNYLAVNFIAFSPDAQKSRGCAFGTYDHFLWHTHQLPDIERMVVAETGLRHCLKLLRGRKILYSNAPRHYAQAVLDVLGVGRLFDAVYTIESTRFQPKPSLAGFRALMARERLQPECTVMVEDMLPNLVAAKKLGMRTVWITRESRRPRWLDIKTGSVLELPRMARVLGI